MIGTAIRKYADVHGMSCDGGYAYGKVNGWHIAMLDSYGVKMLQVYLYPPELPMSEKVREEIRRRLEDCNPREYRLVHRGAVNMSKGRAVIVFQDGPGAIKGMERYVDEILPRLKALDLRGNACACCGNEMEDVAGYMRIDDYVLPTHTGCAGQMSQRWNYVSNEQQNGSLFRGILGAALGAAIGAAVWTAVHVLGYVAGLVGLLIGFLSNFLYGRFGGKNTRARAAVVIAALIVGMIGGQIAGVCALCAQSYKDDGGMSVTGLTCPQYLVTCWEQYWMSDQEQMLGSMYDRMISNVSEDLREQYPSRSEFIDQKWSSDYAADRIQALQELWSDLGVGMLFGMIGCIGLFWQFTRQKRYTTVRKLK